VKISVVITTYNRPDALALVLRGLAAQTEGGFEVVVADDGSREETAAALAGLEQEITRWVRRCIAELHRARLASQWMGLVNHRAVANLNVTPAQPANFVAPGFEMLQGNRRTCHPAPMTGAGLRAPQIDPPAIHT